MADQLLCPRCGAANKAKDYWCVKCRTNLRMKKSDLAESAKPAPEEAPAVVENVVAPSVACQKCGHLNEPNEFYCKKCRANLHMGERVMKLKCGFCGTENDGDASRCTGCSANLHVKSFHASRQGDSGSPAVADDSHVRLMQGLAWVAFFSIVFLIFFLIGQSKPGGRKASPTTATASDSDRPIRNSAWDGSVHQVERYLKTVLRDPSSLEYVEWSPVVDIDQGEFKGHYLVRCKYRAKNAFGGYVLNNDAFVLDAEGTVLLHDDYPKVTARILR